MKVFLFGIDGACPELVFDRWREILPNMNKLMKNGSHARVNTSVPPSTCVAWNCMFTGKDPSHFGIYSYKKKTSEGFDLINSRDVKCARIWEEPGAPKSIVIGALLTFPAKPINGITVGDFLTPGLDNKYSVYPESFKEEMPQDYMFDVGLGLARYKQVGKDELIQKVYEMSNKHVDLIKKILIERKHDWELFINVFIGSDRLQHVFWADHDELHPKHDPKSKYKNVIRDYYKYLDKALGEIVPLLPEDTTIMVASDHGMTKMTRRVNLNDWLIRNGFLVLKQQPSEPTRLDFNNIDWEKTSAYAIGAYFGRIFFNNIKHKEELQHEIIRKLTTAKDIAYKPQDIYTGTHKEDCPDLYIFFNNLEWGVNNDVGNAGVYSDKTTGGVDDANHGPQGIFIVNKEMSLTDTIDIKDIYSLIKKNM